MSDQSNKTRGNTPTNKQTPPETAAQPISQEIIPPILDSVLRTAGVDTRDPKVSKALEISLTTMMFGVALPLPPPSILKEYQEIDPILVSKIVQWTELQSEHRKALEKLKTERSEKRYDRGQWIAATVAIGGLCLAALLGKFGNPWVAIVIAVVSVGGPTAAIWLAHNIRNPPPHSPPVLPKKSEPPKAS